MESMKNKHLHEVRSAFEGVFELLKIEDTRARVLSTARVKAGAKIRESRGGGVPLMFTDGVFFQRSQTTGLIERRPNAGKSLMQGLFDELK